MNTLKTHKIESVQRMTAADNYLSMEVPSKWFVLYTRARHEKLVESQLLKRGIEAFTPKMTLRSRWSDRVKHVEEPLFKGYCFAKFPLNRKIDVLSQKGVVSIVHFNGQFIPVEDSVMNSLKILIESEIRMDPYPFLNEGNRIVINRGPLKGLEGFIAGKRDKNTTLIVSVDAIASSIMCLVPVSYVDPA